MATQIGNRIRRMREAQGLSAHEVGTLVGIGPDHLTALEEGRGLPSVGLVIKLSRILGSRVDGILHGGDALPHPLTVCRAKHRAAPDERKDTEQGYSFRSLGRPGSPGQGMEPLLITFHPGETKRTRPITHEGQEFVFVLEGKVQLVHGGKRCTLGPGDSVYLDSSKPHLFRGLGRKPSRAVGVVWSPGV